MELDDTIAYRLIVSGSVQGVGFRAFAVSSARRLGVAGTVRNLEDGNVEVIAEAPNERMKRFIESLKNGNGCSRTDHIEIAAIRPRGYAGFDVAY